MGKKRDETLKLGTMRDSFNNLNQIKTQQKGLHELEERVQTLNQSSLKEFMGHLRSLDNNQTIFYKKNSVKLLAKCVSIHQKALNPYLNGILFFLKSRLKENKKEIQDSCIIAFSNLTYYLTNQEENQEDTKSSNNDDLLIFDQNEISSKTNNSESDVKKKQSLYLKNIDQTDPMIQRKERDVSNSNSGTIPLNHQDVINFTRLLPPLLSLLSENDSDHQKVACQCLGEVFDNCDPKQLRQECPKLAPKLIRYLSHSRFNAKSELALGLCSLITKGKEVPDQAKQKLLTATLKNLNDSKWKIRKSAAKLLESFILEFKNDYSLDKKDISSALNKAKNDKVKKVRESVEDAIISLKNDKNSRTEKTSEIVDSPNLNENRNIDRDQELGVEGQTRLIQESSSIQESSDQSSQSNSSDVPLYKIDLSNRFLEKSVDSSSSTSSSRPSESTHHTEETEEEEVPAIDIPLSSSKRSRKNSREDNRKAKHRHSVFEILSQGENSSDTNESLSMEKEPIVKLFSSSDLTENSPSPSSNESQDLLNKSGEGVRIFDSLGPHDHFNNKDSESDKETQGTKEKKLTEYGNREEDDRNYMTQGLNPVDVQNEEIETQDSSPKEKNLPSRAPYPLSIDTTTASSQNDERVTQIFEHNGMDQTQRSGVLDTLESEADEILRQQRDPAAAFNLILNLRDSIMEQELIHRLLKKLNRIHNRSRTRRYKLIESIARWRLGDSAKDKLTRHICKKLRWASKLTCSPRQSEDYYSKLSLNGTAIEYVTEMMIQWHSNLKRDTHQEAMFVLRQLSASPGELGFRAAESERRIRRFQEETGKSE